MYLGEKYIASAAVEYRIEVRLTDCAICRSLSFLSPFLVLLGLVVWVLAAIHVEVIWMATEWSPSVEILHLPLYLLEISSCQMMARWVHLLSQLWVGHYWWMLEIYLLVTACIFHPQVWACILQRSGLGYSYAALSWKNSGCSPRGFDL